MNTTIIDRGDLAAYRSWTNRRAAPAYMRGIPSWVWESALGRRERCRAARRHLTVPLAGDARSRLGFEHEAGGGAVGVELSVGISDAALGGGHPPAHVDDPSLALHGARRGG